MTVLPLLLAVTQPVPPPAVQFDRISLEDAEKFKGLVVTVEFRVSLPAYTWLVNGTVRTVTGPAPTDDQERTVELRGDQRGKLRYGQKLKVVGTVRVLHHAAARVGGVTVPAWDEIRLEER